MARVKIGNVFPSDEYLLRRCAPAGYGLGTQSVALADDKLIDSVTKNGWYVVNSSNVSPNKPFATFDLLTAVRNATYCTQIAIMPYQPSSIAIRQKTESGWHEWEYVNPPMYGGVEYRTTERWKGKPVYAALVNVGAFPESGIRVAPTGITATGVIRFSASFDYASLPIPGYMEIYTFHDGEEITVKLQTVGERIYSNDTFVSLYYIKD